MSFSLITKELKKHADPIRAKNCLWFFKTGPGEYGEGDKFIGITSSQMRTIAKKYKDANFDAIQKLLKSSIHEFRQMGVLILVYKYPKADDTARKQIFNLYIKNYKNINNWDLVDISAPHVVGQYLLDKPAHRKILYTFAKSKDLWKKRIAIISTFTFIRDNDFYDALNISEVLLYDTHDLIHKAVGWMLREIGNRNQKVEETFLKKYYKIMPRTMLRYAIEKFDPLKRARYLKK
ncbi:MAG TPA: DNA alkylation repair protein [Candidatus Magasanikbacteria bacterium]|nr:MAG: DNA alkylation repair protein [Candidatus Magasanikbacteria bacterium RIFOXYC2_FULL_39_8]HAT03599.1 DNA alkylation repair protein [Candidatus Magasanikbacteria bacterium]